MRPVLIFGHKNPDNDSVCSAVAYAHLKNLVETDEIHVAVRLGPMPAETAWLFERFGVEPPELIEHVRTRVSDVMTPDAITVEPTSSMREAGRLMRTHDVRALPVVGSDGAVVGLLSQRRLAERYLEETEIPGFSEMPVTVERLVEVLDGELLAGDAETMIEGCVLIGASEPETVVRLVKPGDVLIVGDRVRTQPMALEAGVACLVVTAGARPADEVVRLASERGAALILTSQDSYSAARLISLAHAVGDLMEVDALRVGPDMLLHEAAEDLLASSHREAVVVGDDGRCAGILTRTNIARGIRRRVILVDHNEMSQSAPGIEDAEVIEIVDHHRVGDIQTAGPILFLNLPVGATATIVAMRYETLGVAVPVPIAGILLGAILTDTVLLKSPTTTEFDRATAARLAAIVGVEPTEFGLELFRARSAAVAFDAKKVVGADIKEYRVGDVVVAVAQYESVDLTEFGNHLDEVRSEMERLREGGRYDLVVLMATDIVREGSEILGVGKTRLLERALGIELVGGVAWMPGVLSRKKQIAARLVEASGS